jgi:hypothetical protein
MLQCREGSEVAGLSEGVNDTWLYYNVTHLICGKMCREDNQTIQQMLSRHQAAMQKKHTPRADSPSRKKQKTAKKLQPSPAPSQLHYLNTLIETIEVDLSKLITQRMEYQRVHDAGDSSLDALLQLLTPQIKATRNVLKQRKVARRNLYDEME